MRTLAIVHRDAEEVDRALLRHLAASATETDAAELAVRIGCGAERVRAHLRRLERERLVRRRDTASGPRWCLGG